MNKFIDYTESSSVGDTGDLSNYYTKSQTSSLVDSKINNAQERPRIEFAFNQAYVSSHKEIVEITGIGVTQINIWSDTSKDTKLFTKNFSYSNGVLSQISVIDEINGNILNKYYTYPNGEIHINSEFIGA